MNGADDALRRSLSPARRERYDEWKAATRGQRFVRDPIPALNSVIDDPAAPYAERVLAWAKREGWGKYSLYAIHDDGRTKIAQDCAIELKITKQRVSDALALLEARDRIRVDRKKLYPVISPGPGELPKKSTKSGEYGLFVELWKVAYSSDFRAMEVHRSELKRLRTVQMREYKRWRASGRPSLLTEIPTDPEEGGAGGRTSSVRTRAAASDLIVRPSVPVPSTREKLKTWLVANYRLPTAPDEPILAALAALIPDEAAFEQFREACAGLSPRKWVMFVKVAEACERHRAAYAMAGGRGAPPPLSRKQREQLERMNRINQRLKAKFPNMR